MTARRLRIVSFVIAACVLSAGCQESSSSSHQPASEQPASASPSKSVSYDWVSISYVQRHLPEITQLARANLPSGRFSVVGQFSFGGGQNTVIVVTLDRGQIPGFSISAERHFYEVIYRAAERPRQLTMVPWLEAGPRLGGLTYVTGAQLYNLHYVLLVPKKDDWLIYDSPGGVGGIGPALTWYGDTATVTLIVDNSGPGSNQVSAAVEACQSTLLASPTEATKVKISTALQRAMSKPPKSLAELGSWYQILGQETTCNKLGRAMFYRSLGSSYDNFYNQEWSDDFQTFDGRITYSWTPDRAFYNSLN